jgi:hypothetical protein
VPDLISDLAQLYVLHKTIMEILIYHTQQVNAIGQSLTPLIKPRRMFLSSELLQELLKNRLQLNRYGTKELKEQLVLFILYQHLKAGSLSFDLDKIYDYAMTRIIHSAMVDRCQFVTIFAHCRDKRLCPTSDTSPKGIRLV